ncbi:MAG: hypothetical protein LBG48_05805 [Rickettsiales bacterium]|jgi:hypothetical protein|nr:hypothetical protein [Rickettsiales bacterium]
MTQSCGPLERGENELQLVELNKSKPCANVSFPNDQPCVEDNPDCQGEQGKIKTTGSEEHDQETSSLAEMVKEQHIEESDMPNTVMSTKALKKHAGRLTKSELETLVEKFINYSNTVGSIIASKLLKLNASQFKNIMKVCSKRKIYFKEPEISNICSFNELPTNIAIIDQTFSLDQLVEYRIEGDALIITPFSI